MTRVALDLFCGEGGAGAGYRRAGYEVVGVDIVPRPRYPFRFVLADALTFPLEGYDLVHASPPCRPHTKLRARWADVHHEDLVTATLERLQGLDCPWVLENVPGAPFQPDTVLCGSMFGLKVRRHRWFAHNFGVKQLECRHNEQGPVVQVNGHSGGRSTRDGARHTAADWRAAMEMSWASTDGCAQAIPPAYTEYLARSL